MVSTARFGSLARRHEMRLRIDRDLVVSAQRLARERIERGEFVHLVAEELDAEPLLFVGGIHLDDVAAHAEVAAAEVVVVALVLDLHELAEDLLASDALTPFERKQHAVIGFRRTEAVDARHAGDDDDVAPLEERPGGGQPHPVDLLVDRRFLLDVGVGGRNVRLGLVVVVVADEVLHRIVGKEAAELLVELSRERLVVHHDQRRPVHTGDGVRHGERLAGPGDAEQDLVPISALEPFCQLANRARLVAGELEIGDEMKAVVNRGHSKPSSYYQRGQRLEVQGSGRRQSGCRRGKRREGYSGRLSRA